MEFWPVRTQHSITPPLHYSTPPSLHDPTPRASAVAEWMKRRGRPRTEERPVFRPKTSIDSVHYALNGILHAFSSQRHLRFHFAIAVLVLLAAVVWELPRVEL